MRYFYDTEFLDDGETIDLISIGIIADDGREYYAVNRDADWRAINKHQWLTENVVNQLPEAHEPAWKPKAEIREDVKAFLLASTAPELWAWFAAYDHVVLSQLFGRMLDLPPGIPMYTHDLRSFMDWVPKKPMPTQGTGLHDALEDARHLKRMFEALTT